MEFTGKALLRLLNTMPTMSRSSLRATATKLIIQTGVEFYDDDEKRINELWIRKATEEELRKILKFYIEEFHKYIKK